MLQNISFKPLTTKTVANTWIMAQTGHKSLPMVRRYIRDGSPFRLNAAAAVGL
jgi:hypothetical protein